MTSPTAPTPDPGPDRRWWWIAGGAVAAVVVVVVLVLVLTGGDDTNEVVTPPSPSTSSTSSTTEPATTTTAKPGAPAVTQFTATPSPVTCSGPSAQTTLTWSVAGATNVTVEIDGAPQTTQPFAPVAQTNVPFNCAVAQHNYTLVANGADGQQTRQQLVVGKVTPPTTPPTKPPATTTTHPPVTTTTSGGTTTSTTNGGTTTTTAPNVSKVDVAIGDDGTPDGPMTLTAAPDSVDDGKVVFTIDTTGTQLHSFVILKTDTPFDQLPVDPMTHKVSQADQVGTTIKVKPGKIKHSKIDLVAGNYVLVDNLPGNYQAGARAAFVVTVG